MSQMEYHTGTMFLMEISPDKLEEECEKLARLEEYFIENEVEEWGSWPKYLSGISTSYQVINETLYRLDNVRQDEASSSAVLNEDGSISYFLSFYNGGCGFEEALEEVLEGL